MDFRYGAKCRHGIIDTVFTKTKEQAKEIFQIRLNPKHFPLLCELWADYDFEVVRVYDLTNRYPLS